MIIVIFYVGFCMLDQIVISAFHALLPQFDHCPKQIFDVLPRLSCSAKKNFHLLRIFVLFQQIFTGISAFFQHGDRTHIQIHQHILTQQNRL